MSVDPIHSGEPQRRPLVLAVVPDIPGQDVPEGAVPVPVAEYEQIRLRALDRETRAVLDRARGGDFSGFREVTGEELAAGELNLDL